MGNQGVPHRNRFTPCWHNILLHPSIYGSSPRTLQTSFAPPLLLPSRYFIGTAMATFNSSIAIAADQLATVVSLDFAHTLEGSAAMDPSFLRKAPTASASPGTSPIVSLHASSRSPSRTKRVLDHSFGARVHSLWVGGQTGLASPALVGIDPLLSVSLASGIGSLRPVYEAWKAGTLTTSMITDIPVCVYCSKYISNSIAPCCSLSSSPRSNLSSLWRVTSVSGLCRLLLDLLCYLHPLDRVFFAQGSLALALE